MDDPFRRPSIGSALHYKDPRAALDWLEKAFGFERKMVITDAEGGLAHSEMRFGDGHIMVGSEWADHTASPAPPAAVTPKRSMSTFRTASTPIANGHGRPVP